MARKLGVFGALIVALWVCALIVLMYQTRAELNRDQQHQIELQQVEPEPTLTPARERPHVWIA